jgi:hypothetical protein
MDIGLLLPAGLHHAGDLSLEGAGAEADTAHGEPPKESAGAPAERTPVIATDGELGLADRFVPQ